MKARIRNAYTIFILLAIGALFGVLLLRPGVQEKTGAVVTVGTMTVPVVIADTLALRQKGLSGSPLLAEGTGMLFMFDTTDTHGFWMKDMAYPIDIVWINEGWEVISVTTAAPDSYPTVFYPPQPARYVLELNALEAIRYGLTPGTKVDFNR